jgi:hypothetical protein
MVSLMDLWRIDHEGAFELVAPLTAAVNHWQQQSVAPLGDVPGFPGVGLELIKLPELLDASYGALWPLPRTSAGQRACRSMSCL